MTVVVQSTNAAAETAGGRPPSQHDDFGSWLRSLRLATRLSQTDLASLSHIPQSHISAFESGSRRPGPRRLARLATALGVSAEELCP